MSDVVVTVNGLIQPDRLGPTLIHEHLYADWTPALAAHGYMQVDDRPLEPALAAETRWNPGAYPDNYRLTDVSLAVAELAPFRRVGGRTVVDVTPAGVGRSPGALQEISRRADVHVVMGCGYYLEVAHPPGLSSRSAESVAEELMVEIRVGVGDTGVRPGIIGEIGTGPALSEAEQKVLRGAAWAQRETGLALSVHVHPWTRQGPTVVGVLEEEGVDPGRVLLNHLTTAADDDAYLRALLDRGVNLAFDLFGFDHSCFGLGRYPPSDADVAQTVVSLARDGFLDRLLVSQDVGVKTRLVAYGSWGYAHLLRHVAPLLADLGMGEDGVTALLVENPRRLLSVAG